ncbi:uncharacterized protein V6R79_025382 [Siganus canaliculatus]
MHVVHFLELSAEVNESKEQSAGCLRQTLERWCYTLELSHKREEESVRRHVVTSSSGDSVDCSCPYDNLSALVNHQGCLILRALHSCGLPDVDRLCNVLRLCLFTGPGECYCVCGKKKRCVKPDEFPVPEGEADIVYWTPSLAGPRMDRRERACLPAFKARPVSLI